MTMTANADPVKAVVRLRTIGPSGLNPPQIEVIDRLRTLAEDEDRPITALDVDVWGTGMGITQTADRDPGDTRETVTEFRQWADTHGYALQPAFEWRSADGEIEEESQHGQIVTPLITLAIYNETGERLQAIYPHVDGDNVYTVHDGISELESMSGPGSTERSDDEQNEQEDPAVPLQ